MSPGTQAVNWISICIGVAVGAFTGWYIWQKTMARARQLEAEEAGKIVNPGRQGPSEEFPDESEARISAAPFTHGREDDDLDYFDDDISSPEQRYRDEDEIFSHGDCIDDDAIDLKAQAR